MAQEKDLDMSPVNAIFYLVSITRQARRQELFLCLILNTPGPTPARDRRQVMPDKPGVFSHLGGEIREDRG